MCCAQRTDEEGLPDLKEFWCEPAVFDGALSLLSSWTQQPDHGRSVIRSVFTAGAWERSLGSQFTAPPSTTPTGARPFLCEPVTTSHWPCTAVALFPPLRVRGLMQSGTEPMLAKSGCHTGTPASMQPLYHLVSQVPQLLRILKLLPTAVQSDQRGQQGRRQPDV